MIRGLTYLLGGVPVVVEVQWRGPRKSDLDVAARFPLLSLKRQAPRNVLIRWPDGTVVVRPFRGLRRLPHFINRAPVPCGLCGATIPGGAGVQTTPEPLDGETYGPIWTCGERELCRRQPLTPPLPKEHDHVRWNPHDNRRQRHSGL